MKTPAPPPTTLPRQLGAALLDAHPLATVLVDAAFRMVHANGAARRMLGARDGVKLAEALPCVEGRPPGDCGEGSRCGGCAFHRAVVRALAGESVRGRGFVLRSGAGGAPADLHLLALATPFDQDGVRHAILTLDDANAILADPGIVQVCEGCGRVQDDEGQWHALHRYLEDRLGLEGTGGLCGGCAAGGGHPK